MKSRPRPRPQPRKPGNASDRRPPPPVPIEPAPAEPAAGPIRYAAHVAPLGLLAESAREIALEVERAALHDHRRADRVLALALKRRRDLAAPDHRFVSEAAFALLRWKGWVDPLGLATAEGRLLLSILLDAPTIHPACRVWARNLGRDPERLIPLGDAPTWVAKAEGLKRLLAGQAVTADPWRLFPPWLREVLPLPPGGESAKSRFAGLLLALQTRPPLWVRAQGAEPEKVWDELRALGVRPWVHRRITSAAKIDKDVDIYHLAPFTRGRLEIQDLASQAVGLACDPDPGGRWWDACAGAGGKSLHLAALMKGKGLVVATDVSERKLKETVRRARRGPFRNITTKLWDGKHVPGKTGSFDGVLVDAPCSAIGTWRRNPDARWNLHRPAIDELAAIQARILHNAAAGVRPGGTLAYAVCTLTHAETFGVIHAFLDTHPQFQLDPFPHPLEDTLTDGTACLWPQDADTDAMFLARMVRAGKNSAGSAPHPRPMTQT